MPLLLFGLRQKFLDKKTSTDLKLLTSIYCFDIINTHYILIFASGFVILV
jgi:hypothetical protein